MASVFCLVLGTVFVFLYLLMMKRGLKYEGLLETVDKKEFPGKELYGVGLGWLYSFPALSYQGKIAARIRTDVSIYYGQKYCEFYCTVILSQVYTFTHIILCFFTLLAGFMEDGTSGLVLVLLGLILAAAAGSNSLKQTSGNMKKRADACIEDFPNMVTKLAVMLNSGMTLREAWYLAAKHSKGQLQELMKMTCDLMENGYSDLDALYKFGINSASKDIRKFVGFLMQGLEKGNEELALMIMQQSSELWELKRQHMLQKGEAAATKLVIPTTLMFVGLILVVVSSALTGMSI